MKRQHSSINAVSKESVRLKRRRNELPSSEIQRTHLNFDFDKVCTVTLSHLNVYCCLTCGKYLQGRERNSPVFLHSVDNSHHLFLSFQTLQIYTLPENKIIRSSEYDNILHSIRYAVFPTFHQDELAIFPKKCFDISGNSYFNGFVPLSDSLNRDFCNVILMAIGHIPPLREYLLTRIERDEDKELLKLVSLIVRKQWSPSLFRILVLTDELLGYISLKFPKILTQTDPRSFLLHFLNILGANLADMKNLINYNLQGLLELSTFKDGSLISKRKLPFMCLSLDLPHESFFRSSNAKDAISQVFIGDLLKKYNGNEETIEGDTTKTFKLVKTPQYLVLYFNRFDRSNKLPIKSRNKTLIEFPTKMALGGSKYQLISNIIHKENKETEMMDNLTQDSESTWGIQILNKSTQEWVEFSKNEIKMKKKELLFLDETYIQIWEMIDI